MPRLIITAQSGLEYGGRRYKQGEELELPDDRRGQQWALAFIVRKLAKRSEPVVLGTPPLPPTPPIAPPEEPKQETWFTPPWETIEQEKADNQPVPTAPEAEPEPAPEPTEEPTEEGQPPRRGRRYIRRDLRSEE